MKVLSLVVITAIAESGCASVVTKTSLRPDYATVDKLQTKRLMVVVQPVPDQKPKVGELWATIARKYVNLKRQFIVKGQLILEAAASAFEAKATCAAAVEKLGEGEKVEGLLWLKPDVKRNGEKLEFDAAVDAKLLRCSDGQEIWSAQGAGSWSSVDDKVAIQSWDYASSIGSEVGPYVAPTWNLLRPVLDTLPDPVLNDADSEEKALAE